MVETGLQPDINGPDLPLDILERVFYPMQQYGMGPKALGRLRRALAAKGLSFNVSTTQ